MEDSIAFYKKTTIVLLVLLLGTLGVLIIKSFPKKSTDTRKEIVLLPKERDLVLDEMRILLKSLSDISSSLGKNDFPAVGIIAKATGMARLEALPPEIGKKLPKEVVNMAVVLHKGFDELAEIARENKDSQLVNKKIGEIIHTCVACHAIYKFSAED